MQYKNFKIKLNLNKFIDSRVVEIDGIDGEMEKGLFIPFDKNGLSQNENSNGVYIKAFANVSVVASQRWNDSHYIVLAPPKSQEAKMESLGYIKNPIIGSMGLVKDRNTNKFRSGLDIYKTTGKVKAKDYED